MKKEYLYAVIGLLGGIVIAVVFANNAVNSNNAQMMGMMGMHTQNFEQAKNQGMDKMHEQMMGDEEMTMSGMVNTLEGKTGEDFDSAFIEQMIPHHQGAIDMAKLAKTNASHQELRDMADDIISAQTSEIEMMQEWQKTWGY